MKKTIHHLSTNVLLMAFLSLGCEKERTVKLPPHTPRLVVLGYVETGETFSITVGRTFRADVLVNIDSTYINNAQVILYENGVTRDTLQYNSVHKKYISSNVIAVSGNTYKIVVSAAGFETVESVVTAPFPVPTAEIHYLRGTRINILGQIMDDVIFRFNDPPAAENYYLAKLQFNGGPFIRSFCVYTYDPAVERYQSELNPFEANSCIDNEEIQFADPFFNGQAKEISLSAQSSALAEAIDPFTNRTYRPYLKRFSISKELYQYMKAETRLAISSNDPFAQPVAIQGNITNGHGIFAVMAGVTDTLR